MTQLVFIENGQAVTDSLTIAEAFGKRHDDVLRSIRNLDCSEEFSLRNFAETPYKHPQNGQIYQKYLVTQDGFSFLVMGYTGKEAARFKEMYIAEFNRMREQLTKPPALSSAEIIAAIANQAVEQERRLSAIEKRMDDTAEILALNQTEWRRKTTTLLNKIAQQRGGHDAYHDVRNESYDRLMERAKCKLVTRVTNIQRRMALEGAARSKIDRVSKLDAIAEDARLTEIYLAIVKEMAVAAQVNLEGDEAHATR